MKIFTFAISCCLLTTALSAAYRNIFSYDPSLDHTQHETIACIESPEQNASIKLLRTADGRCVTKNLKRITAESTATK